jgi:hypothetical protein
MGAITYTKHFNFTKGRPGVPRISDANLEIIDEELAGRGASLDS